MEIILRKGYSKTFLKIYLKIDIYDLINAPLKSMDKV